MAFRILGLFICGLALTQTDLELAYGQDLLNSVWKSQYSAGSGQTVDCKVKLTEDEEGKASGKYWSSVNGESVGKGTLSRVRLKPAKREESPLPAPGEENLGGLPNEQALFMTGNWKFGSKRGWFKWEVYEAQNKCRFTGTWGYIENDENGPTSGRWSGTLIATGSD